MDNFCNRHRNKENKEYMHLFFFGLSNLHIRNLRTGNYDKYKYEFLEYHIKPLFIGHCIRGFLTCCIGLSLFATC